MVKIRSGGNNDNLISFFGHDSIHAFAILSLRVTSLLKPTILYHIYDIHSLWYLCSRYTRHNSNTAHQNLPILTLIRLPNRIIKNLPGLFEIVTLQDSNLAQSSPAVPQLLFSKSCFPPEPLFLKTWFRIVGRRRWGKGLSPFVVSEPDLLRGG
jgi:hypothetical protein